MPRFGSKKTATLELHDPVETERISIAGRNPVLFVHGLDSTPAAGFRAAGWQVTGVAYPCRNLKFCTGFVFFRQTYARDRALAETKRLRTRKAAGDSWRRIAFMFGDFAPK